MRVAHCSLAYLLAALLVGCSSSKKPTYEMSPREVDAKLKSLAATTQPALPEHAIALARQNLGQPYELYLLGEAPFETIDPQPVYNLQKSDCVVFLEHTLAMSLASDFPNFLRLLQRIRYADGEIGVRTRNHYTEADWNVNNAWLVSEITEQVSPSPTTGYAQKVDRQRFFKKRYKIDVPTPVERIEQVYIPDAAIGSVSGLRSGDIFNSVKGSPNGGGEFVHHVGFIAVTPDGEVRMIHSTPPRVREQTIASYIAEAQKRERKIATTRPAEPVHRGFKFFRLHEDALERLREIDGDAAPKVALPTTSPVSFEAFTARELARRVGRTSLMPGRRGSQRSRRSARPSSVAAGEDRRYTRPPMNRVVITGMGWVTPMGQSIEDVWRRLLAAESGIGVTSLFDARTFPTRIGAEVRDFDLARHLPQAAEHADAGRSTQFALASCAQAWRAAGLDSSTLDLDRVGIYFASGEGSLDFDSYTAAALASYSPEASKIDAPRWAQMAFSRMNVTREVEQEPNMALPHLAILTGARGPAFNCLTACAASAQAIGEATEILRRGDADVMISGGAHSMIHPFGVTGFNRLTALSTANDAPPKASRPFDLQRGGFVLGEGAGVVILETLEHAQARGATILAEVAGYGSTADAYRITDQHPEGLGAVTAMTEALSDAGLTSAQIDYVSAHGTGTRENDGNETSAIRQVFGDRAGQVPISSIKSMMGHLIAAAGVANVICCVLSIRDGVVPPTVNRDTPDPDCDLDYVPNVSRKAKVDVCLSNSFGFGGQNDTVIVRRFTA